MASVLVLVAAGIVILLANSPRRWSGLVSLGLDAALALDELLIAAITWAGLAAALAVDSARGRRGT